MNFKNDKIKLAWYKKLKKKGHILTYHRNFGGLKENEFLKEEDTEYFSMIPLV
jgi:hypothetical protein